MGLQVMETGSLKRNPEGFRTLVPTPSCWDGLGGGCLGIQPGIWAKSVLSRNEVSGSHCLLLQEGARMLSKPQCPPPISWRARVSFTSSCSKE